MTNPALALNRTSAEFIKLINIMAALRHPETGCPWDLEQNFKSIAHYTIEEAYEVVDAIENNDIEELKNELGDLLLQVVFHAQMATEKNQFDISDVLAAISDKMVARHPHVFGQSDGNMDAQAQTLAWEDHKAGERAAKSSPARLVSALAGVAAALPALMRAQKLQKRAARVGFDWPTPQEAASKIHEELEELFEAHATGNVAGTEEEAGDLLFSCVNVVRKMGVDAENALRAANKKFERRFGAMEARAESKNKTLPEMDLDALEALWQRAKEAL